MKASSAFPNRLAWWRKRRGFSQFRLATAAACSQRHVSFLELGRTKPSREMVLRLSSALDIPLRQANELLLAAGYAPAWSEADLGAEALAPIRSALDHMLSSRSPFPPWSSIAAGTCCRPTRGRWRWSSSWSGR